ncbi:hypothetical protein BC939DRAFT_135088 [Gamsiella multidivaricata]|uniref:uncharacterized protein n=1 Tax=Gamsiella multidivaricata TaxID=101098 RepID=UPI002220D920|nr:uncharacterized protein BC939DRAFT_135088 [Gamsiella multidivaricata]KAI7824797.1 hypothetical protein BC939DRAFT_135088 [Gamsiella multidivaricata]
MARLNGTVWIPPQQAAAAVAQPALLPPVNAGPPRPSADEVMPRRHTIWIESAPAWETGHPLIKEEELRLPLVALNEHAMDIDKQEEEAMVDPVPEASIHDEPMEIAEPIEVDPTADMSQGHGLDTDVMMESDTQLNMMSVPSTGSPVSTVSHGEDQHMSNDITPSPSASLIAKSSSVSERIARQNQEEITATLNVAERPKTPERVVETMRAKPSVESTFEMSPSATVSRRTGQHSRIRPTTIHGEPMAHNYNYPTPTYHEPLPTPKPRPMPSQENAFLIPPKVYHQSQFQQSSPSLPNGASKTSTDTPPVPTRPESADAMRSHNMPLPPPVPSSPMQDKIHRKGTSSSGRLFGFLGNLSKKHGESSTNVASPPKTMHEAGTGGDAESQAALSPPTVTGTSSKGPGSINQVFGRYHHNTDKANQSTKGKRRKTLSLVGGSNEHHQQQIHGGTRPPVPSTEGLGITTAQSGSGTAQRIMGWLRRKSFAKNSSDKPPADAVFDQSRTNGSSPSPVPVPNNRVSRAGSVSPQDLEAAGIIPLGGVVATNRAPATNGAAGTDEGRDPALEALLQRLPSNWTDSKLKWHSGAVEISALSSRHPVEIMFEIKKVVLRLGMEFRVDSDFKVKCVRRRRLADGTTESKAHHPYSSQLPDDTMSVLSSNMSVGEAWTSAKGAGSSVINGKKRGGIRSMLWRNSTAFNLSSSPPPPVPALPASPRALPQVMNGSTMGLSSPPAIGSAATKEIDSDHGVWVSAAAATVNSSHSSGAGMSSHEPNGVASLPSNSTIATSTGGATVNTGPEPLYGEESIDSGEEVRFSIEICRIKNLMGIYCVDIRRMKGNLWAYKFLYHAVLNTLDLNGKGGYIPTLPESVKVVQT